MLVIMRKINGRVAGDAAVVLGLWRGAELGINGRMARKLAANRRPCGSGVWRVGAGSCEGLSGAEWLGEWLLKCCDAPQATTFTQ